MHFFFKTSLYTVISQNASYALKLKEIFKKNHFQFDKILIKTGIYLFIDKL